MKSNYVLLVCLLLATILYSQEAIQRDAARKVSIGQYNYAIMYDYRYAMDTTNKKRFLDRKMLEIGNDFSRFYSMYADKVDSIMYRARTDKNKKGDVLNPRSWMDADEKDRYEDFYMNYPLKGTLLVRTALVNTEYEYEEPIPQMEWQIAASEIKTILGYECFKATTSFRGRDYEAWFAPSIPIPLGPWKFSGLPGLILKACDTGELFSWEAIGIQQTIGPIYIYDPKGRKQMPNAPFTRIVKISRGQLQKLQAKLWDDPDGLFIQHGGQLADFYVDRTTGKRIPYKPGDRPNYRKPYIPMPELE
ncbi:MAG: GLPGLI family protein [Bacteroidales bacterium]